MAISNVKIANMALTELGSERIFNFTDNTASAIVCNLMFDTSRDEVLRSHEWSCAIERKELVALSESPITDDWTYMYRLPVDPYCLKVLNMPDAPNATWRKEGNYLLTNESPVIVRYIKRVTDPSLYDFLLIKALAYKLAADIAIKLTDDLQKKTLMEEMYMKILTEAKIADTEESSEGNLEGARWNEVGRS
jgi:hypothetical protein